MKKTTILLFLFFLFPFSLLAQKTAHYIYGGVFDVETQQVLDSVKVVLLSHDGKKVGDMYTSKSKIVGRGKATWRFSCPQQVGFQTLRFSRKGYEQKEIMVPALHFEKGERGKRLFDVFLQPVSEHQLGEATVVAHKLSYLHLGDTLVFRMQHMEIGDGSMLDVLVRHTPSLVLKKDGQVFFNGREVESVLLNGEDFFGVDGGVLLNNLPAYMVERLRIYEKESQFSEYVGKDVEKREFVMDVELKEDYNEGWTGQALGGAGTDGRYLSRLMALYFTPQLRLAFYGNVNNLTELRQPGEDDGWTPADMDDKRVTTQLGGMDVLLSDTAGRYTFASYTQVEHQRSESRLETNEVNFLPTGDVYRHDWKERFLHHVDFSTSNSLEVHPDASTWYNAVLDFHYSSEKEKGNLTDATFSEKLQLDPAYHLRDSLRLRTLPAALRQKTLNRNEELNKSWNHFLEGTAELSFQRRFLDTDLLNVATTFNYAQHSGKDFDISLADFPSSADAEKEYIYRYGDHNPDRISFLNLTTSYFHWLGKHLVLIPKYSVDLQVNRASYQLYDLHRMPGFSWETAPRLGVVPEGDLSEVCNRQNSFDQKGVDGIHVLNVGLKWQNKGWFAQANFPLKYTHRKLDYQRGHFNDTFTKEYCYFEPSLDTYYQWGTRVKRKLELTYAWQHGLPEMTDFVEEINNVDPLEHFVGNAAMKSSSCHSLALTFQRNREDAQRSFGTTLEAFLTPRDLGELTSFDYQKGVTTYQKYNTHGTYWLCHTSSFSSPLWKKYSPWRLKNESMVQYVHGADYTQESVEAPIRRDEVHTLWLSDDISLHFHRADWRAFVKIGGEWNRASSARPDFESINVGGVHYGISVITPKFWGIQLSSDLTKYNRYGYDFTPKKKELIWNVRLSRDFGKNWLVYFDSFDLLHRLSGLTHALSPQGRVETVCHTIPRYTMLHVVYRFCKSTKK